MSDPAISTASVFHGTIRVGSDSLEYMTSFPSGLRFRCLPGCGLCCRKYRIPLTESDLVRLRQVVDPESCSTIANTGNEQDGGCAAFMENAKEKACCYLDEAALCSVYGNRPLYCRTYPLIRDTYERLEMSVDYTCPGVGEGDPLGTQLIEEAFLQEAESRPGVFNPAESSANYRVICGSLKAMGVYADAGLIRFICTKLVRSGLTYRRSGEILSYLNGVTAALAEMPAEAGNLTDPAAAGLVEKVGGILAKALATTVQDGVEEPGDAGRENAGGQAAQPGDRRLSQDAAGALAAYLEEWVRRQALLRFVHADALARPRRVNVLHPFFAFLARGAAEILDDAEDLSRREGEREITARSMQEAIRKNENPLRSRCASVVSR